MSLVAFVPKIPCSNAGKRSNALTEFLVHFLRFCQASDKVLHREILYFPQCHHMSFVDFVVLPPGYGRIVTDFWGWDAHEAQLRCSDDVWVVIEEDVLPGGALNLNSTNLPRLWSPWGSSPSRKIPTVEPGIEPGTSWLVVRDSDH